MNYLSKEKDINTHKVFIEFNKKYFPVFNIGYSAEGGFFITDLAGKGNHLIAKIRYPLNYNKKIGEYSIPIYKEWKTSFSPKLTHHIDGNAQISDKAGITSGFFPLSKKAKGIATKSFNLKSCDHDGGPTFSFTLWGIDQFIKPKEAKGTCFKKEDQFDNYLSPPRKNAGFVIEGFYYPKDHFAGYIERGRCGFRYPNIGIIPMLLIPAPKQSPGIIGLVCHKIEIGFDYSYGVSFGGSVSLIDDNTIEQLHIFYPARQIFGDIKFDKAESIDFQKWKKIKILIRDKIEKMLKKIFNWFK